MLDPRIKSNDVAPRNAAKAIAELKQMCATINTDQNHQDIIANNEETSQVSMNVSH